MRGGFINITFITWVSLLTFVVSGLKFEYQKRRMKVSENKIITALYKGYKSYTELLDLTKLSKPVLSRRLKKLEKESKIGVVPDVESKHFLYKLNEESLSVDEKRELYFSYYSKTYLKQLEEKSKDKAISNKEYLSLLRERINTLMFFKLLTMHPEWRSNLISDVFGLSIESILPEERLENIEQIITNSEEVKLYNTLFQNHS